MHPGVPPDIQNMIAQMQSGGRASSQQQDALRAAMMSRFMGGAPAGGGPNLGGYPGGGYPGGPSAMNPYQHPAMPSMGGVPGGMPNFSAFPGMGGMSNVPAGMGNMSNSNVPSGMGGMPSGMAPNFPPGMGGTPTGMGMSNAQPGMGGFPNMPRMGGMPQGMGANPMNPLSAGMGMGRMPGMPGGAMPGMPAGSSSGVSRPTPFTPNPQNQFRPALPPGLPPEAQAIMSKATAQNGKMSAEDQSKLQGIMMQYAMGQMGQSGMPSSVQGVMGKVAGGGSLSASDQAAVSHYANTTAGSAMASASSATAQASSRVPDDVKDILQRSKNGGKLSQADSTRMNQYFTSALTTGQQATPSSPSAGPPAAVMQLVAELPNAVPAASNVDVGKRPVLTAVEFAQLVQQILFDATAVLPPGGSGDLDKFISQGGGPGFGNVAAVFLSGSPNGWTEFHCC